MWKFLLPLLLCWGFLAAQYRIDTITDNVVLYTDVSSTRDYSALLNSLEQRIELLQRSTGVYTDQRADIYLVPDRPSYKLLTRGKDSIVEFSEAFYSSSEQRIYVRSHDQVQSGYASILMHEYVHWYLDEIFLGAPLWFHEGMATRYGTDLGWERYPLFIRERFWGNKMDLFELAYRYPEAQRDWELYYLSSYFAVKYMQEKDVELWRRFWGIVSQNHRKGGKTRFISAFSTAYGSSLFQFNQEFSQHTRKMAYLYLVIGVNSFIFMLLPFAVVIAIIRHRRRLRTLPELPEAEEPAEDDLIPNDS